MNAYSSCTLAVMMVLDGDKKYKYIATLDARNKICRTDLIEINSKGEEKKVTDRIEKNHTPCDKFVQDSNAFVRNKEYSKSAE